MLQVQMRFYDRTRIFATNARSLIIVVQIGIFDFRFSIFDLVIVWEVLVNGPE
jgi:hypothetical protein